MDFAKMARAPFLLAITAILPVSAYPQCDPPPPGILSWWPGNGNAVDIVGGNNGTLTDEANYTVGEVGLAFNFTNLDAVVLVGTAPNLQLQNFTIEGWIERASTAGATEPSNTSADRDGVVFGFGLGGYALGVHANGILFLSKVGVSAIDSSAAIIDTNLHHVAVTTTNGNVVFYLDGVSYSVGNYSPGYVFSGPAAIGGPGNLGVATFFGMIDEVSVYGTALSANQIQAIYAAGQNGKCTTALSIIPPLQTATATATLTGSSVAGITNFDGGSGYTNTPLVRFIGGGGSGARAFCVVSNGIVIGITVTNAGYGYTNPPLVVVDPPFISNPVLGLVPMTFLSFSNLAIGGDYQLQQLTVWYWTNQPVNFTASNSLYTQMVPGVNGNYRLALNPVPTQAFATAVILDDFLVAATVTSGGAGYVTSPAFTVVGGGGSGAEGYSTILDGVVTGITFTNAGFGYTNPPTIQIAPPPAAAVTATAYPVMRVDSAGLAPYDNYQVQFKPLIDGSWTNWNGGLFTPTATTNSQFVFITNGAGFFRVQYAP